MALWDGGTTLNTNEAITVFDQILNKKLIYIARRKQGLLYALTGKAEPGSKPGEGTKFQRENKVTGAAVEVRIQNQLDTIPTVANGSAGLAAVTPAYSNNDSGGCKFSLTHFARTKGIPKDEIDRFAGDELKGQAYLLDVFEKEMLSFEKTLGAAINGTSTQTDTTLGSWVYAVDDGVATPGYAVYGGIDRTVAENTSFGSYVNAATGDLSLAKIRSAKNKCLLTGGSPTLGIAGETVYTKVQMLVEPYQVVTFDKDWADFGSEYVSYGGTKFVLDANGPAATLGLLDPESFAWYRRDMGFTQGRVMQNPSLIAAYVLPWDAYCALICTKPNSNAKLLGINA